MTWSQWFDLTPGEVANEVPTTPGVFCVARRQDAVAYATGASLTVLLGVAQDRQRGLRAVLSDLSTPVRSDLDVERRAHGGLRFCFQGNLGGGAQRLYQAVLADFTTRHGEPPRCNQGR